MSRNELIQLSTIYKLLGAYKIFKDSRTNTLYNKTIFNYKDSGYDLEISNSGLYIWPTDKERDGNQLFCIEEILSTDWWVKSVINDDEFSLCPKEFIEIEVGDHEDYEKKYIYISKYSESIFNTYSEEWFFQQMTVQNIIPFEQFKDEVKFCEKILSMNIDENDLIYIYDLRDFDIKLLEGFREI
ncbi:hypothetical protein [Yersinia phage fHe-Yen9-04]|uniref:Uncharacterized protein n=2 Tax=Eneladusvirus Yen904 TaxID=2560849 RepID=A0A2C9CX01_9CAUD|nr:hypothetical protein FDJ41_gp034 [Yersinia phage fHe-Yen9-04]SOK58311.1 hypothetical protein [Yersinia phage fHe-Yen9-04]SOK58849.1 hypothetical protein [Yersinia phage fHe-Yen9-03]VUE36080.1 hypothetical protein [Yersinia phage fHe-Yen9-04]